MNYEASSKGEAYYLTSHMMETSNTSTPQDSLNRASWNEMFLKKHSSTQRLDSVTEEALGKRIKTKTAAQVGLAGPTKEARRILVGNKETTKVLGLQGMVTVLRGIRMS
jgi:hypothetical protein